MMNKTRRSVRSVAGACNFDGDNGEMLGALGGYAKQLADLLHTEHGPPNGQ